MSQNDFTDPAWATRLQEAGYLDFDSWFCAERDLVEEGNFRGCDKTLRGNYGEVHCGSAALREPEENWWLKLN